MKSITPEQQDLIFKIVQELDKSAKIFMQKTYLNAPDLKMNVASHQMSVAWSIVQRIPADDAKIFLCFCLNIMAAKQLTSADKL